jgi:hypothetical protein
MAINLPDIRTATRDYLEDSVTMTVTPPVPDVQGSINPAEEFTFNVKAANVGGPNGVRLIGVIYHVTIAPGGVARLKVPATAPVRATPNPSSPLLTPNSLVTEMFVFPSDPVLDVGDTDFITLKGKAGSAPASARSGPTSSRRIDEKSLFATAGSATATQLVEVT